MLGEVIAMEPKTLKSLVVRHFDFLRRDYGFEYDVGRHRYFKKSNEFRVVHENAKLKLFLTFNHKLSTLEEVMRIVTKRDFIYPQYFSSFVLSMSDVDSRLAYDAKLIQEHAHELLE